MKIDVCISMVIDGLNNKYDYVICRRLDNVNVIYSIEEAEVLNSLKYLKSKFGEASFLDRYERLYISYQYIIRDDKELLFINPDIITKREAWLKLLNEKHVGYCMII